MNRPSHWILLFFAGLGATLWWTGEFERILRSPTAPIVEAQRKGQSTAERAGWALPGPEVEVAGRVIDRLGWPVANATVRRADAPGEAVTTDADGRFEVAISGRRPSLLAVSAEGKREIGYDALPGSPILVVLEDALPFEAAEPVVAPVATGDWVAGEGELFDQERREVPYARVVVRETGVAVRADDTGRYRIPLPAPPVESTLLAYDANGNVAVSEPFVPGRKQGLLHMPRMTLEPGVEIRGFVRDANGEPLAGVTLTLEGDGSRRVVETANGGFFTFAGLVDADYVLTCLPHAGQLGVRLPVTPGDVNLDVPMQAPRDLRLLVVDRADNPQSGLHVVADEGLRRAHARTDAAGIVTLSGVGDGPFDFVVRRADDEEPLPVVEFDEGESRLVVAADD